jgi:hypothetical protein
MGSYLDLKTVGHKFRNSFYGISKIIELFWSKYFYFAFRFIILNFLNDVYSF